MAGVKVDSSIKIQGRDFTPLLKSKKVDWNNDLFCEYSTKHQSQTDMRMYRTAKWKLIRDFKNDRRDELYDLVNDPEETTNLFDSKDAAVMEEKNRLQQMLQQTMERLNDPLLSRN